MSSKTFSIRLDENVKKELDIFCENVGINMSTLFNMCAKAIIRERKIPFEITDMSDPFYSESNLRALRESIGQAQRGETVKKTMKELEAMAE